MKTLNDFIINTNREVHILHRENNFLAFVTYKDDRVNITETPNLDYFFNNTILTDWYPIGIGKTIEEAVINLNIRVSAFISDEGMIDLYTKSVETVDALFMKSITARTFPTWLKCFSKINETKLKELL